MYQSNLQCGLLTLKHNKQTTTTLINIIHMHTHASSFTRIDQ